MGANRTRCRELRCGLSSNGPVEVDLSDLYFYGTKSSVIAAAAVLTHIIGPQHVACVHGAATPSVNVHDLQPPRRSQEASSLQ